MKLNTIFTYGKPTFMNAIAAGFGSKKRANWFIVFFMICCGMIAFVSFNRVFEFVPHPLYREDVQGVVEIYQNLSSQERQQFLVWLNSLPYHRDQPWYDIFDITGRTSPRP